MYYTRLDHAIYIYIYVYVYAYIHTLHCVRNLDAVEVVGPLRRRGQLELIGAPILDYLTL